METIQEFMAFLLILIPSAGGVRFALCLIYMAMSKDRAPYKKRIKNLLIFIVLAESAVGLITLIASYYGSPY